MENKFEKTSQKEVNYKEKYEQGIGQYKATLLKYKRWLQENYEGGKLLPEKEGESLRKSIFIDGMAEALGLSEEDEIEIMKEIGFSKENFENN